MCKYAYPTAGYWDTGTFCYLWKSVSRISVPSSFLGELHCSKALGTSSFSQPKIFGSGFSLRICTAPECCVWPHLIPGIESYWLLLVFRSNPLLGHCLLLQLCLLSDNDSIFFLSLPYFPTFLFPSHSPHSGWLLIAFNSIGFYSVLLLSTKTKMSLCCSVCVSTDCQLNLVLQVKCQWAVLLEGRVWESCPLEVWYTEDGRSKWWCLLLGCRSDSCWVLNTYQSTSTHTYLHIQLLIWLHLLLESMTNKKTTAIKQYSKYCVLV